MKTRKARWLLSWLAAVFTLSVVLSACGGGGGGGDAGGGGNDGGGGGAETKDESTAVGGADIRGEITVITQRTDIVDSVFRAEYVPRFNEKYPNIKVKFEALTDYEGQIKIRMNTKDYGDVLLISNDILVQDYENFFEPLGTVEEMAEKYLYVKELSYQNTVYGIPIAVNANGIVYNKRVFEQAGVSEIPDTPEKFLEALHLVKQNTDAIPLYTNYAAGWTMGQWEPNRTSIAGDPDFVNYKLVRDEAPFSPGKPHYILYKLMYDVAKQGLIEPDPTTTDWESSKAMLARGEIATMVLGSWAITQIQDFADNPDDIGYMPFPYNTDGKVFASSGPDYAQAVNKHSKHKEAALAWLYWFADESGYAESNGGISPLKGKPMPETLKAFEELGVTLISDTPSPPEEEGWVDLIDAKSEVGLWLENFKHRIIEAAIGNRNETLDDIFRDLNERWGKAMKEVTGGA